MYSPLSGKPESMSHSSQPIRIAINGFGRIGRMTLRALFEQKRENIQVVAINDLGSISANAHLFKYDSIHGKFPGTLTTTEEAIHITLPGATKEETKTHSITILRESIPSQLPWKSMDIDIVLECSGRFTKREQAAQHLDAGARRVIVSAPAAGADLTVVMGVNDHKLTADHQVVSCGSCTTNCLAPIADILHRNIGIEFGFMTTIHAYTGDQRLVDTLHEDLQRARAAALSMIPSSTGAAKALGLVLPDLAGKLDGCAIRVPTANVSMIDLKFTASRPTSVEEINQAMQQAASGKMASILSVVDEPLVSVDFNHSPYSSSFDIRQTTVLGGTFCRVASWYDNEWGFSNRMIDLTARVGELL
jgi:glyceraldehyde 3-phosphate dehydrogenase